MRSDGWRLEPAPSSDVRGDNSDLLGSCLASSRSTDSTSRPKERRDHPRETRIPSRSVSPRTSAGAPPRTFAVGAARSRRRRRSRPPPPSATPPPRAAPRSRARRGATPTLLPTAAAAGAAGAVAILFGGAEHMRHRAYLDSAGDYRPPPPSRLADGQVDEQVGTSIFPEPSMSSTSAKSVCARRRRGREMRHPVDPVGLGGELLSCHVTRRRSIDDGAFHPRPKASWSARVPPLAGCGDRVEEARLADFDAPPQQQSKEQLEVARIRAAARSRLGAAAAPPAPADAAGDAPLDCLARAADAFAPSMPADDGAPCRRRLLRRRRPCPHRRRVLRQVGWCASGLRSCASAHGHPRRPRQLPSSCPRRANLHFGRRFGFPPPAADPVARRRLVVLAVVRACPDRLLVDGGRRRRRSAGSRGVGARSSPGHRAGVTGGSQHRRRRSAACPTDACRVAGAHTRLLQLLRRAG